MTCIRRDGSAYRLRKSLLRNTVVEERRFQRRVTRGMSLQRGAESAALPQPREVPHSTDA